MLSRCVTVVPGVSRSGKSTFVLRYLLNAPLSYRFIFDAEHGPQSYAQRLGCDPAGTQHEMEMQLCRGWVLFNPHVLFPGRLTEAYTNFCRWSYQWSQRLPGRKILVTDEAWRYVTPHRYPEELAACVQSGAAYRLECMFATQLPHKLHEAIQNECSEVVCFRLNGDHSLRFARDKGLNPAEVSALAPLHYVARNIDSGGEMRGVLKL